LQKLLLAGSNDSIFQVIPSQLADDSMPGHTSSSLPPDDTPDDELDYDVIHALESNSSRCHSCLESNSSCFLCDGIVLQPARNLRVSKATTFLAMLGRCQEVLDLFTQAGCAVELTAPTSSHQNGPVKRPIETLAIRFVPCSLVPHWPLVSGRTRFIISFGSTT
jgi:hypothetical protein